LLSGLSSIIKIAPGIAIGLYRFGALVLMNLAPHGAETEDDTGEAA
jgi:hypothetical protein